MRCHVSSERNGQLCYDAVGWLFEGEVFPKQTTRKQIKALSFLANGPSSFDTIHIYQRSEQMFACFFLQYHVLPETPETPNKIWLHLKKAIRKRNSSRNTHTHKSQTKKSPKASSISPFTCRFLNFRSCHPSAFSRASPIKLWTGNSGKKPNLQPTYPDPMTGRFCSFLPLEKKQANKN